MGPSEGGSICLVIDQPVRHQIAGAQGIELREVACGMAVRRRARPSENVVDERSVENCRGLGMIVFQSLGRRNESSVVPAVPGRVVFEDEVRCEVEARPCQEERE